MTTIYNPFYDGRTVYFLNVARLQPGDIILTRNRQDKSKIGGKQSSIIAAVGRSNFSHALICSQPPTTIEAIGHGVSTLSIANSFYHEERDVLVLRYGDPAIARRAAAKAGFFLGKEYSVRMAIESVLPTAANANAPMIKTFCSALVAAVYRGSGALEFQAINPHRVTPGGLTRMPCFEDVTAQVSQSMLAPRNIEELTALDGKRQSSPFDGQAKALFSLYATVADDIEEFIRQCNLSLEMPSTFFETLDFIVKALKWATDGSDPLKDTYIPALRLIDRKLADALDRGDLQRMNAAAEARDAATLARDIQESFLTSPDIDVGAARAMLKVTADQIASRGWVLEDQHRAAGLSLAWDRWCDMSASNIGALKIRQTILGEILGRIDPSGLSGGKTVRYP